MKMMAKWFSLWLLTVLSCSGATPYLGAVSTAYPSDQHSIPFNESPTLVQTTAGLVVAWVGASRADSPDASIYLARWSGGGWGRPEKVVSTFHDRTGIQAACSRPVLFKPANGPLLLFYQSSDVRGRKNGYVKTSPDNGVSWSRPKTLGRGIHGPAGVKPIELASGVLVCGSDTEDAGWRVHIERGTAFRKSFGWTRTRDLSAARVHNASQPVLLDYGGGNLQALCRTKLGYMAEMWSDDSGLNWGPLERTAMPNPGSGMDAVRLEDGTHVLVYQHSNRERGVLNLATTEDGRRWAAGATLEDLPGAVISDPAMIVGADGQLHIAFAVDQERIKHLVADPNHLVGIPMVGGNWPH